MIAAGIVAGTLAAFGLFYAVNRLTGITLRKVEGSIVYFRGALPFSKFPRGIVAPLVTATMAAVEDCDAVRVRREGQVMKVEAIVPWTVTGSAEKREEMRAAAERMLSKSVTTRFEIFIVYR